MFEIENENGTGILETETARETGNGIGTATTTSDGVDGMIRWIGNGNENDTETETTEIEVIEEVIEGTGIDSAETAGMDGMEGTEEETDETDGMKIAHVTDPAIEIETETEDPEIEVTEIEHVTELGIEIETCRPTTPWFLWMNVHCLPLLDGMSKLEVMSESARSWPNGRVCSHYQADLPKSTTMS